MNEFQEMQDVYVKLLNMDTAIKEQVFLNRDGSYTIILNSRHTHENQLLSYCHALSHIINRDFEKSNVDFIELEAHGIIKAG